MYVTPCLQEAIAINATDIHIASGKVFFRKARKLIASSHARLDFSDSHQTQIQDNSGVLAYIEKRSDDHYRLLPKTYSRESLRYPNQLNSVLRHSRGLILIAGTSSSGKTTLLTHLMKSVHSKKIFVKNVYLPMTSHRSSIFSSSPSDQDLSIMHIKSGDDAFQALRSSADHLVVAQINCHGTVDTLRHFLFLLHQYDRNLVLDLLAEHLKVLLSTKLLLDKQQNILPLIGIVQSNQGISSRIRLGDFIAIEENILSGNAGDGSLSIDGQLAQWLQNREITMEEALQSAINPSSMSLRAAGIIHNE